MAVAGFDGADRIVAFDAPQFAVPLQIHRVAVTDRSQLTTHTSALDRQLLAEQFEVDPASITPVTRLKEDLDADSPEVVEMIMSLEETFGIECSDHDAEKLLTVGDVIIYIKGKLKSGA